MEAKIQFEKDVLLTEEYYNGIISCRVGAQTVKNLKKQFTFTKNCGIIQVYVRK